MCYTAEQTPTLLKTMTTPDRASLSEEIASWDGKSVAALQSTYERHCDEVCFVATILAHIADVQLQRAATWLLKKHLETGYSLGAADCRTIFGTLPLQEHWESKLHILQCVSYLDVPEDESAGLEKFLETCLESDNKFVRAWTYNGFNELSLRFPRYRERVDGMLAWASVSEAASVRARIRNMTKWR